MIAIKKRVKEIFVNPKSRLVAVLPGLRLLAANLREVKSNKNPLVDIDPYPA